MATPEKRCAAADRLAASREPLITAALSRMGMAGAIPSLPGDPEQRARLRRDIGAHLDALSAALCGDGPAQFSEHCAWAAVFLDGLGTPRSSLVAALEALRDSLGEALDPALAAPAAGAVAAGLQRLATSPLVTPAELAAVPAAPGALDAATSPAEALRRSARWIAAMSLAQTFMRRPQDALAHRGQLARCREDAGFHLAQLASAVELDAPTAFSDYVAWAQEVLRQRGVLPAELERYLGALQDVLAIALPEHLAEVPRRCVRAALDRLARPEVEIAGFIRPEAPLGALARGYLDALRERDRARACQLISDAADAGAPIEDIYLHVIQTCQYEVGRLWQLNQISTAEEHYCTAVTQMVLSQLYPRVAGAERVNRRLVAASVEGNLHEIGARFIADFFEMAGWDTFYLGASTPTGAVLREVEDRNADVLAVSATLLEHLSAVRELFSAARRDGRCNKVVLLVGGQPFRAVHGLWRQVGAHGSARAADEAVPLAEALLAARAA